MMRDIFLESWTRSNSLALQAERFLGRNIKNRKIVMRIIVKRKRSLQLWMNSDVYVGEPRAHLR
ncbi:hypothetical protein AAFG07_32585 [Bradyrhizobium sp. B097]|uniref:hypothetical protein n=1 Tax=Bradyrhizobium sp. B097 TaxID=3140244 RepID=UPI003183A5B7